MSNEEIKTLANGYYAGNEWLNAKQESDTKIGWRQGFGYAMRQLQAPPASALNVTVDPATSYKKETDEDALARITAMYGATHTVTKWNKRSVSLKRLAPNESVVSAGKGKDYCFLLTEK